MAAEVAEVAQPWSDLLARLVVGVPLIGVTLLVAYEGGIVFAVFAGVVGLLALREWINLQSLGDSWLLWGCAVLTPTLAVICYKLIFPNAGWPNILNYLIGPMTLQIVSTLISLSRVHHSRYLPGSGLARFYGSSFWLDLDKVTRGVFLALIPAIGLVSLREHSNGLAYVIWTFAIIWVADTAAYAVGRAAGGPKLWPSLSPNKTWGGFVGACVAGCGAAVAVAPYVHIAPLRAAVAGLLLGALAQGGDLFESALKRRAGVKDSGNLLPGHGGVLDRIDSLIPVAPAVAGAVALGWL